MAGHFIYPNDWADLDQVPAARFELIQHVEDISRWNDANSKIRTWGASTASEFLLDHYDIDIRSKDLIGLLVFGDEEAYFTRFARRYASFLSDWASQHGNVDLIHKAVAPRSLTDAASAFYRRLIERGLPEYVED